MTPQGLKNKLPTCIPDVFACKEDRRKTTIWCLNVMVHFINMGPVSIGPFLIISRDGDCTIAIIRGGGSLWWVGWAMGMSCPFNILVLKCPAQWDRKIKKVQAKKLTESDKSISRKNILTKLHFLQFLKWPRIYFWTREKFKTAKIAISRKNFWLYLISWTC